MLAMLIVFLGPTPVAQPTSFVLEVDASIHSSYMITLDGRLIKDRTVYTVDTDLVEFEVTIAVDDITITQTVIVKLDRGQRNVFRVVIPRVFPTMETA
jgi:hypothetical protein